MSFPPPFDSLPIFGALQRSWVLCCYLRVRGATPLYFASANPTPTRAPMGPIRKPNLCSRLSLRTLGFFSRDAGVVQRTNLGILRSLVCQVMASGRERGKGRVPGPAYCQGAVPDGVPGDWDPCPEPGL